MGPQQVLLPNYRVNLEVMAMKRYAKLPRGPKLEPHHPMQFSVRLKTIPFLGRGDEFHPSAEDTFKSQQQGS